ncbi:phosphoribosylformylglycinamidine synthase subunit PurQ [Thermosediminibacter oceani]|uniref:Phosphoribosylformylglycinamidine synthase subunit PurQ n=1 Tax=Thermosediminibacter oceani (strain ATCC BAA-1034 / DSM 16646 / JW/IW-1228P) TaxID=555079 RepID=D9RY28_THEOJ|nr:phosphoribosylformylglycinamidine synthase subunit PurQ [Thermosediminibacter oceani]ADL08252.1 phosphoribosylformylglycinamidine synthase subunit I [Thermosediminibacter oceani DSM 16646]
MKCAVIVFPGSNCDIDCYHVWRNVLGQPAEYVFHKDRFSPDDFDLIILPGGFSYGDYLRVGAIARFSPAMASVYRAAEKGKLILGICNGFQILLESGLLPGAMMRNGDLKFHCHDVYLKVETVDTPFTNLYRRGEVVRMPIAHGEGNYYAGRETIERLKAEGRIAFYYCDRHGMLTDDANPNGSLENIAGILNEGKNILGMMPHPERCAEEILGNTDGRKLFESILEYFEGRVKSGRQG